MRENHGKVAVMAMRGILIRKHMEVLSTDNQQIGRVDRIVRSQIKLTSDSITSNDVTHLIPFGWIGNVDQAVHLTKTYDEVLRQWLSSAEAT